MAAAIALSIYDQQHMPRKILCITHSNDHYTIERVQNELAALGYDMIRFDSDRFSLDGLLSYDLNGYATWQFGSLRYQASEICAVWYRKLWSLTLPANLDGAFEATFEREYKVYRDIFFSLLHRVNWVNPFDVDHRVGQNKYQQLKMAGAAGLLVPPSLFTNNINDARSFFDACNGQVVMKLHSALSQTMDGKGAFFPTTVVNEKTFEASGLTLCPMIFQKRMDKEYELRVVYLNGRCFTGKLITSTNDGLSDDWRVAARLQWKHYELPEDIAFKLHRFMTQVGLPFGVIDIIRDQEGAYYFLEVNPQGEWGMLERNLNYPIAKQLALTLTKPAT